MLDRHCLSATRPHPWGASCVALCLVMLASGIAPLGTRAQDRPERQRMRTDVPPEQRVSFPADTPFNQFLDLINPIFQRTSEKIVVDPEQRTMPIGVQIAGAHYLDAFERVLEENGLSVRETETAFVVEGADGEQDPGAASADGEPLATLNSREVQINAILFNLNLTEVRNRGLRWDEIFGSTSGGEGGTGGGGAGGGGTGGGGTGAGGQDGGQFFIRTDNLFEPVDDIIQAPAQVSVARFRRFLNVIERENIGRTISNPQVTVQSGEQGQIQIGQDVPIQTTDFAGNTVTEFFETGIIVEVSPTLISEPVADTAGAPVLDFIHMDVRVEDSNSQPTEAGPVINRNQANTQVILLDGEATALGGLITTQRSTTRSGVPILKDLPGWFLGLKYIFGTETVNVTKQELLIVLEAEVVDPIRARAREERNEDMIDERRRQAQDMVERLGERYEGEVDFPEAQDDSTQTTEEPR